MFEKSGFFASMKEKASIFMSEAKTKAVVEYMRIIEQVNNQNKVLLDYLYTLPSINNSYLHNVEASRDQRERMLLFIGFVKNRVAQFYGQHYLSAPQIVSRYCDKNDLYFNRFEKDFIAMVRDGISIKERIYENLQLPSKEYQNIETEALAEHCLTIITRLEEIQREGIYRIDWKLLDYHQYNPFHRLFKNNLLKSVDILVKSHPLLKTSHYKKEFSNICLAK